jgi:phage terminase small subunit
MSKGDNAQEDAPLSEMDANGLTGKQELFCQNYCNIWDKTNAAKAAGYSHTSAHVIGSDLYQLPKIRARIKEILSSKRQEYQVNSDRLQLEIARLAFSDPTEIFEEMRGRTVLMYDLKKLPARHRAAIKSVKMGKYGLEIQFHDKIGAMEMLAKHLGYFEKDNSQKAASGVAVIGLPDNSRGDWNPDQKAEE